MNEGYELLRFHKNCLTFSLQVDEISVFFKFLLFKVC